MRVLVGELVADRGEDTTFPGSDLLGKDSSSTGYWQSGSVCTATVRVRFGNGKGTYLGDSVGSDRFVGS